MVRRLIETARAVHAADAVQQYAIALVTATREAPDVRLGASPRSTLQLLRTARAVACLDGRDYVLPDDLQTLAVPVLAHRLIPTADAQLTRRTTDAIVADIVHRLPLRQVSRIEWARPESWVFWLMVDEPDTSYDVAELTVEVRHWVAPGDARRR